MTSVNLNILLVGKKEGKRKEKNAHEHIKQVLCRLYLAMLQPNNKRCFASVAEEYYATHRGPW